MELNNIKTKAKSFGKKLLLIAFLGLLLFVTGYYFYRTYTISEGSHAGVLYKITKTGKLFKTYEGELQLAGTAIMNKTSTFTFSVIDEATFNQMQKMEGKNIRVYYREKVDAFPWQGETDFLVYKTEEIK